MDNFHLSDISLMVCSVLMPDMTEHVRNSWVFQSFEFSNLMLNVGASYWSSLIFLSVCRPPRQSFFFLPSCLLCERSWSLLSHICLDFVLHWCIVGDACGYGSAVNYSSANSRKNTGQDNIWDCAIFCRFTLKILVNTMNYIIFFNGERSTHAWAVHI